MSICGNCHYQMEFGECDYDCTFEDAVYKEQAAYDSLLKKYEALERKYKECMSQPLKIDSDK